MVRRCRSQGRVQAASAQRALREEAVPLHRQEPVYRWRPCWDLTADLGQADFETRLRVDEYSHVRVVSELSNGELHMDSRYVKVSGGCSAPPNREHPELIGKTILKLNGPVVYDRPNVADVTVLHPNDTGFELNNITVMFIPPHFIRSIKVRYGEHKLFDADLDFSVSEDPTFRFNFVPRGDAT